MASSPASTALIGPNAILQLVDVLDERVGKDGREALWARAALDDLPDGNSMIDEAPVARLHQALRSHYGKRALALNAEAGRRTGDYIIARRIPKAAVQLLRWLPPFLGAPLLTRAITAHAWTFVGSGEFRVAGTRPPTFDIIHNPVVRGERADAPVCVWHAQVFERLFRRLVSDRIRVHETQCAAVDGQVCRFVVQGLAGDR